MSFDLQKIALWLRDRELLHKSFFEFSEGEVVALCEQVFAAAREPPFIAPPSIKGGELHIPLNAPKKYRYWQGGQSLEKTLRELGADETTLRAYLHGEPKYRPREIFILDIETTHLKPESGAIVEVGIVKLNLVTGKVELLFNSLCRENGVKLDEKAWIFNNSSLTVEDIHKAPAFDKIKGDIQNIINSFPLGGTAYNSSFDFSWLESRGVEIPVKLPDPMKVATPICKLPSRNRKRGQYKWPSVQEAWDYFFPRSKYMEKHRGGDDALREAQIVLKLYQMGYFTVEDIR